MIKGGMYIIKTGSSRVVLVKGNKQPQSLGVMERDNESRMLNICGRKEKRDSNQRKLLASYYPSLISISLSGWWIQPNLKQHANCFRVSEYNTQMAASRGFRPPRSFRQALIDAQKISTCIEWLYEIFE